MENTCFRGVPPAVATTAAALTAAAPKAQQTREIEWHPFLHTTMDGPLVDSTLEVGLDNKPPAAGQTAVSSFTELSERFSALLLESAELFAPVSLDEFASGAGTDESADEVLRAALASLGMDADYYAAEQTLVGLTLEKEAAAVEELTPVRATAYECVASVRTQAAAATIQAAYKSRLVRLALADAVFLYNFGATAPPGRFHRVFGGPRPYEFIYCHSTLHMQLFGRIPGSSPEERAMAVSPYTLSEVLVHSSFPTTAPDMLQQVAWHSETGKPADATTSPRKKAKGAKGAAARRAAVAAMGTKLRLAREAALAAKTRVAEVGGELYYLHSPMHTAAEAAVAVRRGVATSHDHDLVSEAQLLLCYINPGVTAADVREICSAYGPVTFVRVTAWLGAGIPMTDTGLDYNAAVVGYRHGLDAAVARADLDGEDLLSSGCISVTFYAGHHHDATDLKDDELSDVDEYDEHADGALDSPDDGDFGDD